MDVRVNLCLPEEKGFGESNSCMLNYRLQSLLSTSSFGERQYKVRLIQALSKLHSNQFRQVGFILSSFGYFPRYISIRSILHGLRAESAYRLIKKMTTATMTRYTNSGLVYSFILASTQHNELRGLRLFHLSLIL